MSDGKYDVPALERGLDIIEFLSEQPAGVTQSQISKHFGLSPGAIFRSLLCLEKRGYIYKKRPEELFYASLKMFTLGHIFPPTQRLLDIAVPQMRELARATEQSCHLSVFAEGSLIVVAQVESPKPAGFSVKLGARFSIAETASGRTLFASQPQSTRVEWLAVMSKPENPTTFQSRVSDIEKLGYERVTDESNSGILDISFPVWSVREAVAALTVPILMSPRQKIDVDGLTERIRGSAASISLGIGGVARW